jgi:hypothetical protein
VVSARERTPPIRATRHGSSNTATPSKNNPKELAPGAWYKGRYELIAVVVVDIGVEAFTDSGSRND